MDKLMDKSYDYDAESMNFREMMHDQYQIA